MAQEELDGKVAVVTGGASGIGRAIAVELLAAGAEVIIADVEAGALAATAGEIGATGIVVDVRDAAAVQALADAAIARCGRVDIVCNNAGVGPMARMADMSLADWRWMIDVNLWGVIHGIHAFLPLLRANPDGGHIVNTASMAGLAPVPTLGAYCATKYGIVGLSETLALELAADDSRIGVSILLPGPVRTALGRSGRNRPVELAGGGLADVDLEESEQFEGADIVPWIDPAAVGALVRRGIRDRTLYLFTHPEMGAMVTDRSKALHAALQEEQAQRSRATLA